MTEKKRAKKKISKKSASKGLIKAVEKKKVEKKNDKKVVKKKKEPKTLKLMTDREIASDFGIKAYELFGKMIKSIVLFGSVAKQTQTHDSDIDMIILLDDVSIKWDQALISWYREELNLLMRANPYKYNIHVNTIKLSTWWDDLMKGDPVVLNIIRHGQVVLDHAGFIEPLKYLMIQGKIKGTPEAVHQCLQRAPSHLARSRAAELAAVEGIYWSMVDAAHGALIAAGFFPPSPEHVMIDLKEAFVDRGLLKMKYVLWYKDMFYLHKKIDHREIWDLKGADVDLWQDKAEEFMKAMISLVEKIISGK
jgi:predicted nucleotidyltransferase/uncharacterized protein (UPF0332 family)